MHCPKEFPWDLCHAAHQLVGWSRATQWHRDEHGSFTRKSVRSALKAVHCSLDELEMRHLRLCAMRDRLTDYIRQERSMTTHTDIWYGMAEANGWGAES